MSGNQQIQRRIAYFVIIPGLAIAVVGALILLIIPSFSIGVIAVGLAFIAAGMTYLTDSVLQELRLAGIDEKVAVFWAYARDVTSFQPSNPATSQTQIRQTPTLYFVNRVEADIRSLGRIGTNIPQDRRDALTQSITALIGELNSKGYDREASEIRASFQAIGGQL
jgi:hypothetical protein